jgi:hypothetical protein
MVHYLGKVKATMGAIDPSLDTSPFQEEAGHLRDLKAFDFDPPEKKLILGTTEKPISIAKMEMRDGTLRVHLGPKGGSSPTEGSRTEEEPGETQLLRQIAQKARKRGFQVHSARLQNALEFPPNWDKSIPDLLVKRLDRSIAYLYASAHAIQSGTAVRRWEAFDLLEDIQVTVVVKSRQAARRLSRIKKQNGLQGRIIWMRREKRLSLRRLKKKATRLNMGALFLAVLLAAVTGFSVSGLMPNVFQFAGRFDHSIREQTQMYQPKDVERQVDGLQQQINRLRSRPKN